jgi:alpha-L-rhamnosidase
VFALDIGVPESETARVVAALKNHIDQNDGHLHTGIFGTRLLFETLSDHGLHEMAYEALNKKTEPGFGYWLADGATTTREFWDNGGSHNHPMFGGGLTWFYRKLAGMQVDPGAPGYKHIIFRPQPVEDLSFVKYFNETVHGQAGIHWKQDSGTFNMQITVPVGSTATVYVPADNSDSVTESGNPAGTSEYVEFTGMDDGGYAVYKVSSGNYEFRSAL